MRRRPVKDWQTHYENWQARRDAEDRYDAHWISPTIDQRTLAEVKRDHIVKVIGQCHGHMTMAAAVLDIHRASLYNYVKLFGIKRPT